VPPSDHFIVRSDEQPPVDLFPDRKGSDLPDGEGGWISICLLVGEYPESLQRSFRLAIRQSDFA
jgi:hypothetical protein